VQGKKRKHCWNSWAFQFAQDLGFPLSHHKWANDSQDDLASNTHLWCLWHLSTNCSFKLWSSTIRPPKQEGSELCCVVGYATLTKKQGCSGLGCQCKMFIVHTSNHAHTSPKTFQAWCIAKELHLKQGEEKRKRPCKKYEKIENTSHSNFVAKNHKSQVQPRSTNDMHFACYTQTFAGNTFAFCIPQSVKH
jgi:hypothetical protein